MSTDRKSVEVDAPVKVVYNQWTQFESLPAFIDGVESISQTDATHRHWWRRSAGRPAGTTPRSWSKPRIGWCCGAARGADTGGHSGRVSFENLSEPRPG